MRKSGASFILHKVTSDGTNPEFEWMRIFIPEVKADPNCLRALCYPRILRTVGSHAAASATGQGTALSPRAAFPK